MRMVQRVPVLRANVVDHAAAVALIDRFAIIGGRILVPDRMAERDVEAVHRRAIAMEEIGDLLAVSHCPKSFSVVHRGFLSNIRLPMAFARLRLAARNLRITTYAHDMWRGSTTILTGAGRIRHLCQSVAHSGQADAGPEPGPRRRSGRLAIERSARSMSCGSSPAGELDVEAFHLGARDEELFGFQAEAAHDDARAEPAPRDDLVEHAGLADASRR